MTGFSGSPRLVKGGLVLIDPVSGVVTRVISLQYNPDTLSRTLQVQGTGEGSGRTEALRLKGPPVETIKLEAEIDATDRLEFPAVNADATTLGIHPQLAALETIAYPSSIAMIANELLSLIGTVEIVPMQAPLTLFVWSAKRIVPVRITDFTITEEAFDPRLNPIRAKVSLGLRVLTPDDLGFLHRGGAIFMAHLIAKESLARQAPSAALANLGIGSLP
jgi:hypothetical protein